MPLNANQASDLATALMEEAGEEWRRLEKISRYHRGDQADPYTPKTVTPEFRALKERSKTNLIPLVTGVLVDRQYIDGYRPDATDADDAEEIENSEPWRWWQANGMDSRQKQVFEATAKYGYSFVQVWPGENAAGEPTPVLAPRSPRSWYARYDYPDDDFPRQAIRASGTTVWLLDDEALYRLEKPESRVRGGYELAGEPVPHGMGVCPLVRFLNAYPDEDQPPMGEVEPLIGIQDRINQTVFDLLVAQTYQGAPQQYIAGVVADSSDIVKSIAKRVWTFDEPTTQVGQLTPADLSNLVTAIENALRIFGLRSQTPPHYLLGEMVNMAAEALVAAEASLNAKVESRKALNGESAERMFRLAGVAAGDREAAGDISSQVVWRSTDPRSLANTVDALGKMVQMLKVPADEAWPMIPGVTQQTAARWRRKALQGDPFVQLQDELERQAQDLGF